MAAAIQFILNGRTVRIDNCSPNTTLLEFLRGAGLTGAKEGCAEGDCGACAVVMVDRDAQGRPCYRAINSCLVPVCLMAGREIVSVEGVAPVRDFIPCSGKWSSATARNAATAPRGSSCRSSRVITATTSISTANWTINSAAIYAAAPATARFATQPLKRSPSVAANVSRLKIKPKISQSRLTSAATRIRSPNG